MDKKRLDPEKALQQIQEEERQANLGKLKIYLGAAPGVGKTHAMLEDALQQREQGLDVVAGIVESHGRKEINNLLSKFEVLPKQEVDYHGKKLMEFDLKGAIKRDPALILVDEMAHSNAPGAQHHKRWQDIKEILENGIDVYTTLNIQHIESLNDVVAQIIGVRVHETVPDSVLVMADTIVLVDLPPEDLLKRLAAGKVYFPAQAELAKENFFQKGNLIALRELALRVTAERVETQVLLYRRGRGIQRIWPTQERILVCVGSKPESVQVIRIAKRMADHLQTDWLAVYVEAPRLHLSEQERAHAIQNLHFAETLGAETKILTGLDLVKEIMAFAREQNITTIVIGKRIRKRWRSLFSRSLADELVRHSREINVYIITFEDIASLEQKVTTPKTSTPWRIYAYTLSVIGLATLIDFLLFPFVKPSSLIMVYLLGITIISLFGQFGPAILGSILSVLIYDFCFVPPRFTFATSDIEYLFTLVVMLIVSLIISHLTIIGRRQTKTAGIAEKRISALHQLSRKLAYTRGAKRLLETSVQYLAKLFDSEVIALLPKHNHLEIIATDKPHEELNEKELSIAKWSYDLGQMAGSGTDTLSFSEALYVPLIASQGAIGVLRVKTKKLDHHFTSEQLHLLEACANQIGLALEVERLYEEKS